MARPVQLPKGSRFIVLASICVVVAALYFAQEVLVPLALAILFSFLLAPLVTRVQRWGVGRIPAVIIVATASLGLVFGIGWITTVQLINLGERLPDYKTEIVEKVKNVRGRLEGKTADNLKKMAEAVERASTTTQPSTSPTTQPVAAVTELVSEPERALSEEPASPTASPIGSAPANPLWVSEAPKPQSPLTLVGTYLGSIVSPLGTAGLVIVFVIFMLLQREDLRDRMIRLVGKGQIHVTTSALDDAATRISRYLMAQAIVNGTYGIAISIGLWVIGHFVGDKPFPSFVLWGLLCAFLRFIPYIGPWIAAAFPLALSLAVYNGFSPFLATLGLFVVIELLSNNFMEPWLYGSSTGMSTVAVLVSAVFWTWLWGPIGLLLATPLTVCLVVLGKHVPQLQFLDILLGDEPVLEPPDRVYQRLLALDQEEATDLAEKYLEEHSLEWVFDEVLLPALALAEQDRHRGRLGEERETFVMQAMRDMIDELGDAARELEQKRAADGAAANAPADAPAAAPGGNGKAPSEPVQQTRALIPAGCTVNVVCLPARDEGDEIAGLMFCELLALRGYCAFSIPVASLASEMVEAVEKRNANVVVVSALPPGAVSYSRYLCKRLHARLPELPLGVGVWTLKGDLKKAKERITCAAAVQVETSLRGMLEAVNQMAQATMVQRVPAEKAVIPSEEARNLGRESHSD